MSVRIASKVAGVLFGTYVSPLGSALIGFVLGNAATGYICYRLYG